MNTLKISKELVDLSNAYMDVISQLSDMGIDLKEAVKEFEDYQTHIKERHELIKKHS